MTRVLESSLLSIGTWNVPVGLKWALMSRTDSLLNLSPLQIAVSKKVTSETDISAINVIVGWCLITCSMNWLTTYQLVCKREIMSSSSISKGAQLSRICISILAMKIFAKAAAIFVLKGTSVRLQVILFVELR